MKKIFLIRNVETRCIIEIADVGFVMIPHDAIIKTKDPKVVKQFEDFRTPVKFRDSKKKGTARTETCPFTICERESLPYEKETDLKEFLCQEPKEEEKEVEKKEDKDIPSHLRNKETKDTSKEENEPVSDTK